ncbi:MAG: hypothetical protein KAT35_05490, partial [Candidatus Aenigmarchaeota archaeon]|nr:hypothetical protein [Candidatus Aenigmarchaeota archaeon]
RKVSELPPDAVQFEKTKGVLGFLINMIEFDKKHSSALHYVFGNTLLVKDTATAKRLTGRVRAVTLEGELFERSGVITGGSFGSRPSLKSRLALERFEKQLEDVKKAKKGAVEELYSLRELMGSKRKEKALLEVKIRGLEIELESMVAQQEKRKGLAQKRAEVEAEVEQLKSTMLSNKKKAGELTESLSRTESELSSISKMLEGQEVPEERAEELALIEGRISELTEKRRGLDDIVSSKGTEVKLLEESITKGREELKQAQGLLKETRSTIGQLRESVESDSSMLEESEAKLRDSTKKMSRLYEQQQKMSEEIESVSKEKGAAQFNFTQISNELAEVKSSRQMAETRLGDLKAEWAEYTGIEPMKMSKGELEDRIRQIEDGL